MIIPGATAFASDQQRSLGHALAETMLTVDPDTDNIELRHRSDEAADGMLAGNLFGREDEYLRNAMRHVML